jgi:hypothetical protein
MSGRVVSTAAQNEKTPITTPKKTNDQYRESGIYNKALKIQVVRESQMFRKDRDRK